MSQITSSDPSSVETNNDYQFSKSNLIGDGSFSQVFLLSSKSKNIAVKVIDKKNKPPNYGDKMFQRQVKILRVLSHPNLVKFIGSYSNSKAFEIGMEYCPGKNLREILRSPQQIPQNLFQYFQIKVCLDIINGLSFLSKKMIVYRDIKPENVMVEIDQSRNISTTMIDFGSARFIFEEAASFIGTTYCYMAPQIFFRKPYSEICDNWSLGILFFQLFTVKKNKGRICSPFKQNFYPQSNFCNHQFYNQHIWLEGISLEKKIPQPFRKIIRGLLNPNPQKRMKKCELVQILINEFDQFSKVFTSEEKTEEKNKLYECLKIQAQRVQKLAKINQNLKNIEVLYGLFLKIKKTLDEDKSTIKMKWILIIVRKIKQQMNKIEQIMESESEEKREKNEYSEQIKNILSKVITSKNIQDLISDELQCKQIFCYKGYHQSPKFSALNPIQKNFISEMSLDSNSNMTKTIQELLKRDFV